ncbi:MAG: hypothetical protein GWN73_24315, partial [Actinobacteria bacterium]|nr:hypothetical protein [Actinomycetota bacterium]NIS33475.1 hypothetical protein [Actinomycetota bacterium]NIU68363.1 hypothetical protein [Actinomycetota bacterium]
PELESVEDKGTGATYVSRVTATTPEGEVVNVQRATIFVRGAGSGEPRQAGPKPPAPTRGDEVAS